VLLAYPPNFYPESDQDIYDFTKAVCDATSLGVILFPMFLWGFSGRIHPSDIPARLIRRFINDIPNLAVIKAEGGAPSIMGAIECHRLFGEEVVISVPIEGDLIPLAQVMPIQLSATSDHEYYGPMIPRVMRLLHDGKLDDATEIYWQLHPARKIKSGLAASLHGGNFLTRQAWKFQGWLQGYNGGPLRMPTSGSTTTRWPRCARDCSTPGSRRAWTRSASSSLGATRPDRPPASRPRRSPSPAASHALCWPGGPARSGPGRCRWSSATGDA
jgi:4-hydroxy-tetrahydrodipicolinate synthase